VTNFFRIASTTLRLLRQYSSVADYVGPGPTRPREAPRPATRPERALGLAAYVGYYVCLALSAVLLVAFAVVETDGFWLAWTKIALGAVLLAEGFLLAKDWRGVRRMVLWRIQQRRGATVGEQLTYGRRLSQRISALGIQLLGVAWIAGGTFVAAMGLEQLL
jgi:hypothetical protein